MYVTVTVILPLLLCIFLVMVSQQILLANVKAFTTVDKVPNVPTLIQVSYITGKSPLLLWIFQEPGCWVATPSTPSSFSNVIPTNTFC